jgi:hypothetical protein
MSFLFKKHRNFKVKESSRPNSAESARDVLDVIHAVAGSDELLSERSSLPYLITSVQ